jgi:hypothetical protein
MVFHLLAKSCLIIVVSSRIQVGSSGGSGTEATSAMMQRFWDSAMSIGPLDDEYDSRRSASLLHLILLMVPVCLFVDKSPNNFFQ